MTNPKIAESATSAVKTLPPSLAEQLPGAWRLQSFVETNLDTGERLYPLGEHPVGYCLFTSDGHVALQMASAESGTEDLNHRSFAGRFELDEEASRLALHILVSPWTAWLGTTQLRNLKLLGEALELSLPMPRFAGGSLWASSLTWVRPDRQPAAGAEISAATTSPRP